MTEVLRPGDGFIFMKVGTHAQEPLGDIIARKRREIADAGYALWGYGGNTCHPFRVQPFAQDYVRRAGAIYLCMQPMTSRHFAAPVRAAEQSVDGIHWQEIPRAVNVVGSRFALAITDLEETDFVLPLDQTQVAVGAQVGRPGDEYLTGHVDKACLVLTEPHESTAGAGPVLDIGLVARLGEPYAVLLR